MLKVNYSYSGKHFVISPYTSLQEKDLLLLSTVEETDIDIALDICGIGKEISKDLTNDEKIAMLYKLREISVGGDVNISFKCEHCNQNNENIINIENIVKSAKCANHPKKNIIDKFTNCTEYNLEDFIIGDVEEMDLDEYENLLNEVKSSVTSFEFLKPTYCQKCTKENLIKIDEPGLVLELMSEDTLIGIYKTYNDLIFHGTYSKLDIDSLYPFERTILLSLLNKSREDMNNA